MINKAQLHFKVVTILLIASFLFFDPAGLSAQSKFIKIEDRSGKEVLRLLPGDEIIYSVYGDDGLRYEILNDAKGDGQFIITNQAIISTRDIQNIVTIKEGAGFFSSLLNGAGASLVLSGIVSLFFEEKVWEAIPIGAGMMGGGLLLNNDGKKKNHRLDRRSRFLKVVDVPLEE